MSQHSITNELFPRRVPRRSAFFLFVYNNFRYIIAGPILVLVLFLKTNPILSLALGVLIIFGVSTFWTIFNLDISIQSTVHPHHRAWNRYKSILSIFAPFVQNRPAWQISLGGLLLANIPLFLATWPLLISQSADRMQLGIGFDLYWLAYIPVLLWVSYRAHAHVSEWFGALWLFAASIYSFCFFVIRGEISLETINHLAILMIWFLIISVIIHSLFRKIADFRGQAELLRAITGRLRDDRRYTAAFDVRAVAGGPDPSLNDIAEQIGTMLFYDRVFILVRDDEKEQLWMKGRYGTKAPWPEAGWSLFNQNSITGWVALNKDAHLCSDTRKCSLFFNPAKAYPCKSEAAVPILVENECVGVIDIESDQAHAFHKSDIRLLWQIANSIGAALSYERHVSKEVNKAYQLLEQASEILVHAYDLDEALKKVAQMIREIFGADLIVLYKHAVATCVPLPGLITDGTAIFPKLLGHSLGKDSRVNELIRLPQGLYIQSRADLDPLLLGPNNGEYSPEEAKRFGTSYRFVKREKIKSIIYLKLGLGDEIVGSLFLNYRERMVFQTRMIRSLMAFANLLTMSLILKRKMERAVGPLAGTIPLAHSSAEAAFESVSRDFNDIDWDRLRSNAENRRLLKQVNTFREKLEELRRQWTNLILVEQANLHRSSLVEPITHLESKLHSMFPTIKFEWDSREFLDISTDELGEVIYKVIAEGVSNALVHAHADHIYVRCRAGADSIEISITNNGTPIGPSQAARINELKDKSFYIHDYDKATGIISILLDARRWFGADWQFSSSSAHSALLTVCFPLAPIPELEDEYQDENDDNIE
jgi:GAF domain-containing protein